MYKSCTNKEVFDFIIDFYEEEYLQRFVAPRRGKPVDNEERSEIYRFWNWLKSKAQDDREEFLRSGAAGVFNDLSDMPEIPPLLANDGAIRTPQGPIGTLTASEYKAVMDCRVDNEDVRFGLGFAASLGRV